MACTAIRPAQLLPFLLPHAPRDISLVQRPPAKGPALRRANRRQGSQAAGGIHICRLGAALRTSPCSHAPWRPQISGTRPCTRAWNCSRSVSLAQAGPLRLGGSAGIPIHHQTSMCICMKLLCPSTQQCNDSKSTCVCARHCSMLLPGCPRIFWDSLLLSLHIAWDLTIGLCTPRFCSCGGKGCGSSACLIAKVTDRLASVVTLLVSACSAKGCDLSSSLRPRRSAWQVWPLALQRHAFCALLGVIGAHYVCCGLLVTRAGVCVPIHACTRPRTS